MKPLLVVMGYNRPRSLARLLDSLAAAEYPPRVRLLITIDPGGENGREVGQLAAGFSWPFGEKNVLTHPHHLGLVAHFLHAGDRALQEEGIVLLEDDNIVSPMFYHFARQALEFTAAAPEIGGISLNALWFNGYTQQPFVPYLDDSDIFYLQVPWYQGMAFSGDQWRAFYQWRQGAGRQLSVADGLHDAFFHFPQTEWFPLMMKYLVRTKRTFLFPRQSLSSNFGDRGTHFTRPTPFFQVPLQTMRREFRLRPLQHSTAVYDSFHELLPDRLRRLAPALDPFDLEVDLYGTKEARHLATEFVLSTKPAAAALRRFGRQMWPLEANVIHGVPGNGILLARRADLDCSARAIRRARRANSRFFRREGDISWPARLARRLRGG